MTHLLYLFSIFMTHLLYLLKEVGQFIDQKLSQTFLFWEVPYRKRVHNGF